MSIKAFVMRYEGDSYQFMTFFLASAEFDVITLRNICRKIGLPVGGKKTELVERIAIASERSEFAQRSIIQNLVRRDKGWVTFKLGTIQRLPELLNPTDLVTQRGEEKWYGPVECESEDATWYVRPVFIQHWEMTEVDGKQQPVNYDIRWLCFARVAKGILSLHWRGFSYAATANDAKKYNSQFPYWEYVPVLIEEFEEEIGANVQTANLSRSKFG